MSPGTSGTTASPPAGDLDAWLTAAGHGDTALAVEVYEAVAPQVYGLVLRVLGDADRADAVTWEVFHHLWPAAREFDPRRGSARSWVLNRAHRAAVEALRIPTSSAPPTATARPGPLDGADSPGTGASSLEDAAIRWAMAALSPAHRTALELAYLGGQTCADVSRRMHVPLDTARSHIRDGLVSFRDRLATAQAEPA